MAAEANVSGMWRIAYFVGGSAFSAWGLWGADQGWTQWAWLIVGGSLLVFGFIGFSPLHATLSIGKKKAN